MDQLNPKTAERCFRQLLHHAWQHSPFYRELYGNNGIREQDLDSVDLEDLPVVTKADVMLGFDRVVTDERLRRADVAEWATEDTDPQHLYLDEYLALRSSAGSDIVSLVPYTLTEWRRATSVMATHLLPDVGLCQPAERTFFFLPRKGHHVSSSSAVFASRFAHELLHVSLDSPVEEIWARVNAFQPQRIHSSSSRFRLLVDWCLAGKIDIQPQAVVATGDRLSPALRAMIKRIWNADIYELYAAAESPHMAIRGPRSDEFQVLTDLNVIEVVGPDGRMVAPGEHGRVVLTSLAQSTLPLIRYDLTDWAVLGRVGVGAESLQYVDGKVTSALPIRLLSTETSRLECYDLHRLELPRVEQLQYVSYGPDEVEIRYRAELDLDGQIRTAFGDLLTTHAADVSELRIKRVERIANDATTGKFYDVIGPDQIGEEIESFDKHPRPLAALAASRAGPASPQRNSALCRHIPGALEQIADQRALETAVYDASVSLTYQELTCRAKQISCLLQQRGCDLSRPVAIYADHSVSLLTMMLGVLYAGGFYLVVESDSPAERIHKILAETYPATILTDPDHMESANEFVDSSHAILNCALADGIDVVDFSMPEIDSDAPACIIYTSGTTGSPKGVVLGHGTILNRVDHYSHACSLNPDDNISLLQSPGVNAGVRDLFGAFLNGATLALYHLRARGTHELANWLHEQRITVFYTVPSVWRIFLETLADRRLPNMRLIRLGGEPLNAGDVNAFQDHFSAGCTLVNGYAATETGTIALSVFSPTGRPVAGRVPVGYPTPDVQVSIEPESVSTPQPCLGEIVVKGPGLANGYWDAVNRAVQPFKQDGYPSGDLGFQLDDQLMFLTGRKGTTVVVHGYRIHLGAVEEVMHDLPDIEETVAVLGESTGVGTIIRLFYVSRTGHTLEPKVLRRALTAVLPGTAISVLFHAVAELPREPDGKVDRALLVQQNPIEDVRVVQASEYRNQVEAILADFWREVLNREVIDRDDNFFDLGGDSLLVFQVLNRIQTRFSLSLTVIEFFDGLTLSTQADLVLNKILKDSKDQLVA